MDFPSLMIRDLVKKAIAEAGEFPLWSIWLTVGIPFSQSSPTLLFSFLLVKAIVYAIYIVQAALGAKLTISIMDKGR